MAKIPDFDGIPMSPSVWVLGWSADYIYFQISGYGGNSWHGNDYNDPRKIVYRVTTDGKLERPTSPPTSFSYVNQNGAVPSPPFLKFNTYYDHVTIGIDADPLKVGSKAVKLQFDKKTGEPFLSG